MTEIVQNTNSLNDNRDFNCYYVCNIFLYIFGFLIIMFIFVGIIGFIYAFSGSVTVAVVGILITLGLFGASVFADVPDVSIFLYIITILAIALLVTTLYIKRRF